MRAAGIICEYNPFHRGHEYHIAQTRELLGQPVVCVMSGNFVQRGDFAVMNKHSRAEAAVRCGADLVIELPVAWAMAGARTFGRGAVGILASLGIVSHVSFGSECGDAEVLARTANLLISGAAEEGTRRRLSGGVTYAAAREDAVRELDPAAAAVLASPNDTLAVEYIRAAMEHAAGITPLAIPRVGVSHDEGADGGHASASHIRGLLLSDDETAALDYLPPESARIYARERNRGRAPAAMQNAEAAILGQFRRMTADDFAALPDVSEGLENRLCRGARDAVSLDTACMAAKTKRYTYARLRRIYMSAYLGLTADMSRGIPPYARALALNDTGRELLREITDFPVVTKAAAGRAMGGEIAKTLEIEARADDLYALAYPGFDKRYGGQGWTVSPTYVRCT